MSALLTSVVLLAAFLPASLCLHTNDSLPTTLLHQFPNGTWVENLAVRSNGQLVATIASSPDVYQVDPQKRCDPFLIHHFANLSGTVGITETAPDIFQIAVGNFSLATFLGTPGSFTIFEVNLTSIPICPNSHTTFNIPIARIADVPGAAFLDGLTTLPQVENLVLAADLNLGVVWQIDIDNGNSSISIDDPLMKPGAVSNIIGVDGIKIRDGVLYFTNPGQNIIGMVPIDTLGHATGNASEVVPIGGDDFAIDQMGQLFSVGGSGNLSEVFVMAQRDVNLTIFPGPTACQFGRGASDQGCLYVTTSGGDGDYAEIPVLVGGAVYSVDVFQNGSCEVF
jgi:hypothetical protein